MNTFQITSSLEDIYPDVEGELCSKHTVLLNQIQKTYRRTFPMHPPTHYAISKAVLQLAKTSNSTVSMAMEQGTIIMFSAGDEGAELHISSNILEDIVLEGSGKAINSESQTQLSLKLRSIVELATEDLSLNRINGGFLYIHCQSALTDQNILNSMLICFFMAIITLNDLLEEYSQQELISKLKTNQHLHSCDIDAYFSDMNNRQFQITGSELAKIHLQKRYKLLFLSLDFLDQKFYARNEGQQYEQIIAQLIKTSNIANFFNKIQDHLNNSNDKIVEQLKLTKQQLKIKTFILCDKYAIFLVEAFRYAELIGKISKYIHKFHSDRAQTQDNGELMNRFSSSININSILFSSVPSRPLSILDPSDCIWY